MCFQLRDAMRVGNISFSDEFFSTTQTTREVKQVLEDELVRRSPKLFSLSLSLSLPNSDTIARSCAQRNFCILVEVRPPPHTNPNPADPAPCSQPAKTPFGKTKKTYSGKCGGRNDDLVRFERQPRCVLLS